MGSKADRKRHAEECRVLARSMTAADQRATLLEMAETWERLAGDGAPDADAPEQARPDDASGDTSGD